ncbi:MAG: alkyl/aryl-sulfatase [Acidimicrobiales bacterium]
MVTAPQPPTEATRRHLAEQGAILSLDDEGDWERAGRGRIAGLETSIGAAGRRPQWDQMGMAAAVADPVAPDSVHPSLWRQARLNSHHGLFEVTDGVWQARGYDISNVTFLAGTRGWVVIDPLTTAETAAACLELANRTLGERPVTAVIYTHSHVDHFGGVLGVTTTEAVDAGDVRVIAPVGFMEEVVAENVVAGPAMRRRASYMYGSLLPVGPLGHIDAGLGKTSARGQVGLIPPTEIIAETGQELIVDGLRIVFQNTPGAEAPAEMNFHFPDKRLLCLAENCSHNLHNLYTLRGAQVRDALGWSKYLHEALLLFGHQTDIAFASHHWPRFGHDDAVVFIRRQRDVYRWIHDQTMRLANRGLTAPEIAETLEMPGCFARHGDTRGYYGTVKHNARAVYQRYLGWFDGNPANLDPHPPEAAAARYVAAFGGPEATLALGRQAFDDGDYRWAAEVLNHLVFARPDHAEARELQARTFEQLGYRTESGPWRGFYLTGAMELRDGVAVRARPLTPVADNLPIDLAFDGLGVRLDATGLDGARVTINWRFPDLGEDHVLGLENCTLHHTPGRLDPDADVTLTLTRPTLGELLSGAAGFTDLVERGAVTVDGDDKALRTVLDALESFPADFTIVEP